MKKLLISLSLVVSFTLLTVNSSAQGDSDICTSTYIVTNMDRILLDPCPLCGAQFKWTIVCEDGEWFWKCTECGYKCPFE